MTTFVTLTHPVTVLDTELTNCKYTDNQINILQIYRQPDQTRQIFYKKIFTPAQPAKNQFVANLFQPLKNLGNNKKEQVFILKNL